MPNPAPSTYFSGVSIVSGDLVFTTSNASPGAVTFSRLTNAEANGSTGDIRKLAYAILMEISERHTNFSPSTSRPVFATASDAAVEDSYPNHGRNITLSFTLTPTGVEEVVSET